MTIVKIGGLEVAFQAEDSAGAVPPRGAKYVILLRKAEGAAVLWRRGTILMNVGWPGNGESEKTVVQAHATDLKTPGGKLPMPLALDLFVLEEKHIVHPGPPRNRPPSPRQHETDGVR